MIIDAVAQLPPLRDVIATHQLRATKSLGQNFLLDLNLTDKIVRLAGDVHNLHVVEIGPGPGGLTRALLKAGAQVTAVDLDRRVPAVLADLINAASGRLNVIEADALTVDLQQFGVNGARAIVANLPYNIATPLLIGWLNQIHAHGQDAFQFMHLMFQREVADRIIATPGNKVYGRLSVMAQWLCDVKIACTLPASAFTPAPKVESAIVHFIPKPVPHTVSFAVMEQVVAQAFGQRRKMLRAVFKSQENVLLKSGIDPTQRAENLDIAAFVRLAEQLQHGGNINAV